VAKEVAESLKRIFPKPVKPTGKGTIYVRLADPTTSCDTHSEAAHLFNQYLANADRTLGGEILRYQIEGTTIIHGKDNPRITS
jgi:hypothetical protein